MKTTQKEEIINVTIPFRKVWKKKKDGSWSGHMAFKFEDCIARVLEDGEEIGEIGARLGGGYEMQIKGEKETNLYATVNDIWNAYCKAIKRDDLIFTAK